MYRSNVSSIINFLSKECKNEEHPKCCGNWIGLGFNVDCNCSCHQQLSMGNIKNVRFREKPIESDRNSSKSVVESNTTVAFDNESNGLKKSIEPVDKSFRGSNQQVPNLKGEE